MLKLLAGILSFGLAAGFAATVDGKWTGHVTGRDGNHREVSFVLRADGGALTGKSVTPMGEFDIRDGKIAGDDISFRVVLAFRDPPLSISYTGKLVGDEIRMKSRREGAPRAIEFTLKRSAQ